MNALRLGTAIRVGMYLGWTDLRQAYKRTLIGQFWITIGMIVGVAAIGVVYGFLFKIPPESYLPFLASGLVFWNLITATASDGALSFIHSEGYIRGSAVPHFAYVVRIIAKAIFTFAHNLVVIPLVLAFFPQGLSPVMLLAIPGFVLGVVALTALATVLAFIATRFRDVPPIIASVMTILFYVSPVIWPPEALPEGPAQFVVLANPFASILQVMRLPLINQAPTAANWIIASVSALVSVVVAILVFRRFDKQIAFWV